MEIKLRLETSADYRAVEELTRDAFWGYTHATSDEHVLVHVLRSSPAFLPELDYVAEIDGVLVGNIVYTKSKIISADGTEHGIISFGPLSVHPRFRGMGVGSALIKRTIAEAQKLGYRAMAIYGHPDYYPRLGFRNAKIYGITTPDGRNFDALMALPLYDGALDSISGALYEDQIFDTYTQHAAYDDTFPYKEPAKMQSIAVLLERLPLTAGDAISKRDMKDLALLTRVSGREMLTWDGIDEAAMAIINDTMTEFGLPKKLLPSSPILA